MTNSFLFIIPLTPKSHLTQTRKDLQALCILTLLNQTHHNWKALLIGEYLPDMASHERFCHITFEGVKELKLQVATKYIFDHNITSNYIIRLDDDDIINPTILKTYSHATADVIVDTEHWFIEWESKAVSKEFRPWFPNTFFHKFEHAFAIYGKLSNPLIPILNNCVRLIENNHAEMHDYYRGKSVLFNKQSPIYLRVLNRDSITSRNDLSYIEYLHHFGFWDEKLPSDFFSMPTKINNLIIDRPSMFRKVKYYFYKLKTSISFRSQFNAVK